MNPDNQTPFLPENQQTDYVHDRVFFINIAEIARKLDIHTTSFMDFFPAGHVVVLIDSKPELFVISRPSNY